MADGTYAPQSPDLSSFLSSPSKTQQAYNPHSYAHPHPHPYPQSTSASYAPRSPVIPSFDPAPPHNFNSYAQNASLDFDDFGSSGAGSSFGAGEYMPPIPALPPTHSFLHHPEISPAPYFSNTPHSTHNLNPTFDFEFDPTTSPIMSSRGGQQQRIKAESSSSAMTGPPPRNDPNPNKIEIKTKFPVARIKRIMQADEEVGKVAQVTPVAVSKALELFMIALVTGAADKARERGGKKVSAQHLKAVVEGSPEQFDFLAEIVGRVGEAQEGASGEGKKRKTKGESEESSEEEKKVKPKRGKKKKGEE